MQVTVLFLLLSVLEVWLLQDAQLNLAMPKIRRGSYMSAHVLLILLNKLGKRDKMQGLQSILSLFETSIINSIIQEHQC